MKPRTRRGLAAAATAALTAAAGSMILPAGAATTSSSVALSSLSPTSATNGYGPYERNMSNGESNANDGHTFSLRGKTFASGLGAHAPGVLTFAVPAGTTSFTATLGVDDEVNAGSGSVRYTVWGNGVKLYTSPVLTKADAPLPISVPMTGVTTLKLQVDDGGDGYAWDHADWADARLVTSSSTSTTQAPAPTTTAAPATTTTTAAPTTATTPANTTSVEVSSLVPTSSLNGWGPVETNQSNGESASGDGSVLSIGGTTYPTGLGVHANSKVTYNLAGAYTTFSAVIGLDDEILKQALTSGSVTFEVWADGTRRYVSPVFVRGSKGLTISVPVSGVNTLDLVMTDAGDGIACDHGDWAIARLTPAAAKGTTSTTQAPTTTSTTQAPTTTTTAPPVAGTRNAVLWPFASNSPWNTPIGSGAAYESPTAPKTNAFRTWNVSTWMNTTQYSVPIYTATMSDPVVTLNDPSHGVVTTARVPSSAVPAAGTDSNMAIIQPDGRTLDVWVAKWSSSNTIDVSRLEWNSLSGSGLGPQGGIRASGLSSIGGLIRRWEVDPTDPNYTGGAIRHALAVSVPGNMMLYTGGSTGYDALGYGNSKGYQWPASEQDYVSPWDYKGPVPMGSLLAIPKSVNLANLGLSASGYKMAKAVQDYGAYVVDMSGPTGSVTFYGEPSIAPTTFANDVLGPSWSARDLTIIRSNMVVISNSSPTSIGGGGTPLAPTAPGLG
jgi:hypothetical protein